MILRMAVALAQRLTGLERRLLPRSIVCDHDAEHPATLERHLKMKRVAAHKAVAPGIPVHHTHGAGKTLSSQSTKRSSSSCRRHAVGLSLVGNAVEGFSVEIEPTRSILGVP